MKYDHQKIEKKWQKIWKDKKLFKSEVDPSKPKYYILDMFPYPSGAGLHVGHVTGYTATDILARYKRQKGFNVLHPMGWDSFGLPAEQYAIRTGTHPRISTEENIKNYRRQLESLGFSYDWDREIATSDPNYYKWTQWIFTILYKKGLAYEAEMLVNFCPALGTVLANEEVENGKSKEGGYPVERRPLRQWILKITDYAEKLLEDLDLVDWPESLKKLQINWIGKSEGAKVFFQELQTGEKLTTFTTRPDTLFGVSYLVLAPEHPLVPSITTPMQKQAVEAFLKKTAAMSDIERTGLNLEKEGVWTGAFALHPITSEKIPIWIADYVIGGYGTGAVQGVPAHDERDFAFAKKYHLPILPVIDPDTHAHPEAIPDGMAPEDVRIEVLAGKRCWVENGLLIHSTHDSCSLDGLSVDNAMQHITAWLEKHSKGEKSVNYKLRDWLFSRQRYWGEPFPILHFEGGTKRALELDELPLCPPELDNFQPTSAGESPLARIPSWVEIIDTKTGKKALRETNIMPQWAGSCWYYLRFCDPKNPTKAWSHEAEKYWMPVDLYVGGVEHAVLHLLYARFWHKVLYDSGLVSTKEPFQTLRNQGLIRANVFEKPGGGYVDPDTVEERKGRFFLKSNDTELQCHIEKMSKSKLNGVSPDLIIEEFGADSLRLYEMFMGPFDKEKLWNTDAVNGCKRFLNRFYDLVLSDKVVDEEEEEGLRLSSKLVYQVEKEIENLGFNTSIAKMMEFLNAFSPLEKYSKKALQMAIQVLYPFAPHFAEEAWEHLGGSASLTYEPFPQLNEKYLHEDTTLIVVQVNGKLRGKWTFPKDCTQEEILSLIEKEPRILKHLTGKVGKIIYVPNKLVNLVIEV
jgi:leucyl-tRNA synthetase